MYVSGASEVGGGFRSSAMCAVSLGWVFRLIFLFLLSRSKSSNMNGLPNIEEENTRILFKMSITSNPETKRRLPTDPKTRRPGFWNINSYQQGPYTEMDLWTFQAAETDES